MASSESRKRKLEEYEMQLFGFHSRAVYATLKNMVHERIQYKIKKLCETMEKTYKPNSENLKVLKRNQKQLQKAYYAGAIPHLKNIENVVNKYISIPSNVLLKEDKCQKKQCTDTEFESAKQNLENLQQRAKRATILNAALKEELQILEQFTSYKNNAKKMCNAIETGLTCPDTSNKMSQIVKDYKQFTTVINSSPVSHKIMYNSISDVKCKDCDFDSL